MKSLINLYIYIYIYLFNWLLGWQIFYLLFIKFLLYFWPFVHMDFIICYLIYLKCNNRLYTMHALVFILFIGFFFFFFFSLIIIRIFGYVLYLQFPVSVWFWHDVRQCRSWAYNCSREGAACAGHSPSGWSHDVTSVCMLVCMFIMVIKYRTLESLLHTYAFISIVWLNRLSLTQIVSLTNISACKYYCEYFCGIILYFILVENYI